MGNFISSTATNNNDQNNDVITSQYVYPTKNGNNYFSTHFIMGGEKFETSQPEAYLFGENLDLNFLGNKPIPFPYSPPKPQEPTRTLKALVNIRRESLKFVKSNNQIDLMGIEKKENLLVSNQETLPKVDKGQKLKKNNSKTETQQPNESIDKQTNVCNPNTNYNIEFIFDSDVKCAINIFYFCNEEIKSNSINYISKNFFFNSPTFYYECGSNQLFSQPLHIFNPSLFNENEFSFKPVDEDGNFNANNTYPVVIQCISLEGNDPKQSHSLIATIERNHDKGYNLKPYKQKIFVDGLLYLIQEIYGIEKKNPITVSCSYKPEEIDGQTTFIPVDDEMEDNGSECVVCMVECRDTLILPCKHLCLCNLCADSLRYQATSCPICRAPFRALLHIKAVRKSLAKTSNSSSSNTNQINNQNINLSASNPNSIRQNAQNIDLEDLPSGYDSIQLLEALNGPFLKNQSISFSMKNILLQKNNTNSINETSQSENLTPKSQRSNLSGQLSTNLSNGLNVSSFNSGKKQKLRKQDSNNSSLYSLKNDVTHCDFETNMLENKSISLVSDVNDLEDCIDNNWPEKIELATGTNLSTKSTSSSFSNSQETSKLLSSSNNKIDNNGKSTDSSVMIKKDLESKNQIKVQVNEEKEGSGSSSKSKNEKLEKKKNKNYKNKENLSSSETSLNASKILSQNNLND